MTSAAFCLCIEAQSMDLNCVSIIPIRSSLAALLLTSYVTRLMPRTSLMMRPDTFLSSVGQLRPVCGHEVAGLHSAQGDNVIVGAAIAHHPTLLTGRNTVKAWLVRSYQVLPVASSGSCAALR